MELKREFLQSRVARRVFFLFITSALVPLIALSVLAYTEVGGLFRERGFRNLQEISKSYGMGLFQRLLVLDGYLQTLSKTGLEGTEQLGPLIAERFVDIQFVDGEQLHTLLADADLNAHLMQNRAAVVGEQIKDDRAIVRMYRYIDPAQPDAGMLVADFNPVFLCEPYTWRQDIDLCVFTTGGVMLFCSTTDDASGMQALFLHLSQGSQTDVEWKDEAERPYLASTWQVFLKAQFAAGGWRVLVRQPESFVFEAMQRFSTTFPIVVFLSLLVVGLLSVTQIRRQMIPLEQLIAGIRRFGHRDFGDKVSVTSGDEFEELAGSLNSMAESLNEQFDLLDTFSNIDELILCSPKIDAIVELVLESLQRAAHADYACVILPDRDAPARGRRHAFRPGHTVHVERVSIPHGDIDSIRPEETIVSREDVSDIYLDDRDDSAESLQQFVILAVSVQDKTAAMLCVGFVEPRESDEAVTDIKGFADRLAVGLSSIEREEKLVYQAHYDALTSLPNRQLLKDRLEQEIIHCRREGHESAVLFIDLDRFKYLNDSFGHTIGDHLLVAAAERLQACVRETDTVARLGGDEFTLILSSISGPQHAGRIAEYIVRRFAEPFVIEGYEHYLSASIGITLCPSDASDVESLLRNADTAMYRAKDVGRNTYAFFEDSMNSQARRRVKLESSLRHALDRDEMRVVYQPQIQTSAHGIRGAEALLRWHSREYGEIPPATFIPIAEETGIIVQIGEWILEQALLQFRQWSEENLDIRRLGINVSVRQLQHQHFGRKIRALLEQHQVPPHVVELEITESMIVDDNPTVVGNLAFLRDAGFRISVDDFGTGYSSLNYLSRVKVDSIKIDQSFIKALERDTGSSEIVKAIIAMVHSLRREVIAEGVETEYQYQTLREWGCDWLQGYYIGRPGQADTISAMLRAGHPAQLESHRFRAGS